MLSRYEVDIRTNQRVEVKQRAYQNQNGDIVVLDDGERPPNGFDEVVGDFKPAANGQK